MSKCFDCGEELPKKDYRGQYSTIRQCKCGAMNSVDGGKDE